MADKLLAVTASNRVNVMGKYDAYSNGRYTPIIRCLNYIVHEPLIKKIIGNGFGAVENITKTWSFNDIIEIFMTYGLLGLFLYSYCIYGIIKNILKGRQLSIIHLLIVFCWFTIAMISLYFRTTAAIICFMTLCCTCLVEKEKGILD